MKKALSNKYFAPHAEVIEIKVQAVLCQSGGADDSYTPISDPDWFS